MLLFKYFRPLLFIIFLLSCNNQLPDNFAPNIDAKVIRIIDGDTIEILHDGKPLKIRLAHIDCPEIKKGQPFNKAAKQMAADLCFGQQVQVLNEGEFDRWGRLIAVIINDKNQHVNKEMICAGLAWHYKKYSSDTAYANLEMEARKNKIGIWVDENPIPPWEWRQRKTVQ